MRVVLSRALAVRRSGRSEWVSATTSKRNDLLEKAPLGAFFCA